MKGADCGLAADARPDIRLACVSAGPVRLKP
jgi:hypothetical protein